MMRRLLTVRRARPAVWGALLVLGLAAPLGAASAAGTAAAGGPAPTVTGPVTGGTHGRAYNTWPWPLADYGYRQAEYFISGTARAYGSAAAPAPYRTRIQVFSPVDATRRSGTAVVEWQNVTAQSDIPLGWIWTHPWEMQQGHTVVLVSAQEVGVCGSKAPGAEVCSPTSIKGWDPVRYASLHHPGDDYSFDMYSQAVQAVREPGARSPLAGLGVQRVLGYGQSQSATQLDAYLCNGADAGSRVLDAVLIDADLGVSLPCRPRVPTIQLWSEESAKPVFTTSGPRSRIWMVAGAPHEDRWQASYNEAWTNYNNLGQAPSLSSNAAMQADAGQYGQEGVPASATSAVCLPTGNAVPRRYVVDAALQALQSWVVDGTPAPVAPSLRFQEGVPAASFTPSVAYQHDADGTALGGVRLPVVDVPVSTYIGSTCGLFGESLPLSPVRLAQLYPSHAAYVGPLAKAATRAVTQGFLLPVDAADLVRRACASTVGGPSTGQCPSVIARSPYRA